MITIASLRGNAPTNLEERGIHVELGGIEDFLSTAPLRTPPTNHWHEGEGSEVDLGQPTLAPRTIKLPLVSSQPQALRRLVGQLQQWQAFRIAHHTGIAREVTLKEAELVKVIGVHTHRLELDLYEFAPKPPKAHTATPTKVQEGELTIDGAPLSSYGFTLLKSGNDTSYPKEGVIISEVYYPRATPNSKTYSVQMQLASIGKQSVNNYQALIHTITQPGEHTLNGRAVYYKRATVNTYCQVDTSYILFTLDLQII